MMTPTEKPTFYHGRNWDAPLTDDAVQMPDDVAEALLNGEVEVLCDHCGERLTIDDDVLLLPYLSTHLECHLRTMLGDVQHLEQRCLCARGTGNEITRDSDHYETFRDSARATLQWLLDHNRGCWR